MPKVKIDCDELYPYWLIGPWGDEIDVPQETLDRWAKVEEQWLAVQKEMEAACKAGHV